MREFAADLADRLGRLGELDFVSEFCAPLPGRVIAEILGIEPGLHREFSRGAGHLVMISPTYPGDELAAAIKTTLSEIVGYLKEVVAARRIAPRDDTVSDLVRAEVDGCLLTADEVISFLCLLLVAGFETTMHLLGTMMLGFTQRPDDFSRLRAEPSLIPAYVEEALRAEPPVHAVTRMTLAEADLGGVKVPAGAMVLVLLGSNLHEPRDEVNRKQLVEVEAHGPLRLLERQELGDRVEDRGRGRVERKVRFPRREVHDRLAVELVGRDPVADRLLDLGDRLADHGPQARQQRPHVRPLRGNVGVDGRVVGHGHGDSRGGRRLRHNQALTADERA